MKMNANFTQMLRAKNTPNVDERQFKDKNLKPEYFLSRIYLNFSSQYL